MPCYMAFGAVLGLAAAQKQVAAAQKQVAAAQKQVAAGWPARIVA